MRNRLGVGAIGTIVSTALAIIFAAVVMAAQAPAAPPQGAPPPGGAGGGRGQAPLQVPNPTYAVIALETAVNKPAADVWKRVGKYCDIGEWLQVACTMTSGKDGEVGAVRSIGNEILVGRTELSYTYTQPVREGRIYDLYHGTLEARPVTATTSKLVYTLVYDNSQMADDAAREADKMRRTQTFTRALDNMKILAEGGTLPARGGGAPGAGGAGRGRGN
jgi:hypothetical protein